MDVTEDQLLEAYKRVPRPIREFLSDSQVGPIAASLAQKYALHVDASGILADIITKTLVGLIPPQELAKTISEKLFLEQTMAQSLIADINASIFMPLQQRVKEAAEEERQEREAEEVLEREEDARREEALPPQAMPQKPAPIPPPALSYEPAPSMLPGTSIPVPPPVAHVPPPMPAVPAFPINETLLPVAGPVPQQVFHPMPAAQTNHPGWQPAAAVHVYIPTAQPQAMPVAPIASPIPEAPVSVPYREAPAAAIPSAPSMPDPMIAPEPAAAPAPLTKNYGADPYREPI